MDNDTHISIKCVFNFSTDFYSNSKSDVRLNKTLKLNFILMIFDTAYPARPFGTVTKYTI